MSYGFVNLLSCVLILFSSYLHLIFFLSYPEFRRCSMFGLYSSDLLFCLFQQMGFPSSYSISHWCHLFPWLMTQTWPSKRKRKHESSDLRESLHKNCLAVKMQTSTKSLSHILSLKCIFKLMFILLKFLDFLGRGRTEEQG